MVRVVILRFTPCGSIFVAAFSPFLCLFLSLSLFFSLLSLINLSLDGKEIGVLETPYAWNAYQFLE